MKIGTRSLLFGYHQFLIHPLFVALSWWRLYGFPWDVRLWVAFIVHDWGYWGKPNMDGQEGELHPWTGAKIMGFLFDARDQWGHKQPLRSRTAAVLGTICDLIWGHCPERCNWYCFTFYHSRFLAKRYGRKTSRLCVADKAVALIMPMWLQLVLWNLSGEIHEYMLGQNGRTSGVGLTQVQWYREMRKVLEAFVQENT